ncbi:hypothetical protein [Metabacillus sp. SLBN-84]
MEFSRGLFVDPAGRKIQMIQLGKQEIINLQFDRVLEAIKMADETDHSWRGFGTLMLFIQGYDDVTDELYEIPKVRRFFARLYKKVPHMMYYLNPVNGMNSQFLIGLSDFTKVAVGEQRSPQQVINEDGNLDDVGHHHAAIELPEEIGFAMIKAVKNHALKRGFSDLEDEMPPLVRMIQAYMGERHVR